MKGTIAGEQNTITVDGPDYQLRAQVSAILKTNLEIVKMNAVVIKQLMEPPTLVDNEALRAALEATEQTKEGDKQQ